MGGFTFPGFMREEDRKTVNLMIRHYASFPPEYDHPRSAEAYWALIEYLPKMAYPYELIITINEGIHGYA